MKSSLFRNGIKIYVKLFADYSYSKKKLFLHKNLWESYFVSVNIDCWKIYVLLGATELRYDNNTIESVIITKMELININFKINSYISVLNFILCEWSIN